MKNNPSIAQKGFTIIELLIAMIISGIVSAIVYATFSSVLESTETANLASEQLYTQSFLTRHLNNHVAQASSGWQPGAVFRPYSNDASPTTTVMPESLVLFEGLENGEEDSLSFTTTAPMFGVSGYPGFMKQVTYSIVDGESIEMPDGSPYAGHKAEGPVLLVTEVPVMSYNELQNGQSAEIRTQELKDYLEDLELSTPIWTFPVGAMEIRYYNGEDWVDSWDLTLEERLPWAIEVNLFWSPWGENRSVSLEPDNQFTMIIAVPGGVGLENRSPEYARPLVESTPR